MTRTVTSPVEYGDATGPVKLIDWTTPCVPDDPPCKKYPFCKVTLSPVWLLNVILNMLSPRYLSPGIAGICWTSGS